MQPISENLIIADSPAVSSGGQTQPQKPAARQRTNWYRYLAISQAPFPRLARWCRRRLRAFSMPAPHIVTRPILWIFIAFRTAYYLALRVFICEPLFKAYCKSYGKGLRTDCFIHWITGKGDIVVGNNVTFGGKSTIAFAARFAERPFLKIGDHTGVGHNCMFIVGKGITIGRNCTLSGETRVMDSNGHSADPENRFAHSPPADEDVRPVVIGDGVWIGVRCILFPGVRIGEGAVVSAGSVVRTHVPPYSVVAGNPAKVVFRLPRPQ